MGEDLKSKHKIKLLFSKNFIYSLSNFIFGAGLNPLEGFMLISYRIEILIKTAPPHKIPYLSFSV